MASLQAYFAAWILKRKLKPKLAATTDAFQARKLFVPPPFKVPRGVRVAPETVGGVAGERVETANRSGPVLLYLHGGGYFGCSAETHRPITTAFARHGFRVFAPDYRLAPEHPFPAAVDDALACYRGLLDQGTAPGQIVVSGDSAGGGLALAMLLSLRDSGVALPAAAMLFSPWTDLAATGDSMRTNNRRCAMFYAAGVERSAGYYLAGTDPRNPLASPFYADLSKLPPILIHVGKDELLLDDSTRLAGRGNIEVKVWPVVPHVWQLIPIMPEARHSMQEASEFLRAAVRQAAYA